LGRHSALALISGVRVWLAFSLTAWSYGLAEDSGLIWFDKDHGGPSSVSIGGCKRQPLVITGTELGFTTAAASSAPANYSLEEF